MRQINPGAQRLSVVYDRYAELLAEGVDALAQQDGAGVSLAQWSETVNSSNLVKSISKFSGLLISGKKTTKRPLFRCQEGNF